MSANRHGGFQCRFIEVHDYLAHSRSLAVGAGLYRHAGKPSRWASSPPAAACGSIGFHCEIVVDGPEWWCRRTCGVRYFDSSIILLGRRKLMLGSPVWYPTVNHFCRCADRATVRSRRVLLVTVVATAAAAARASWKAAPGSTPRCSRSDHAVDAWYLTRRSDPPGVRTPLPAAHLLTRLSAGRLCVMAASWAYILLVNGPPLEPNWVTST